jgi:peroxiredoxin (alkyl hydroperoxide reductase subunit C)
MSKLANVGEKFPEFSMKATVSLENGKEFKEISNGSFTGKWAVVFFYPHDFTFICPTELAEFSREIDEFKERSTEVYSVSTDSHFVHLAWRREHPDLKDLKYPMLADYKKDLSEALGVLHPIEKVPYRATFVVDPDGIIRWVSVNDLSVGRNVKEVIRVLDALQTDELCPCNWEKGKPTL